MLESTVPFASARAPLHPSLSDAMTSPLAHLTPDSWPAVSALLDQALALPPPQRTGFVDALIGDQAQYRDTLRHLLAQATGVETGDFLATLPRIAAGGPAAVDPLGEPAVGAMVGPYRLLSELGAGGMGTVWLAERADGTLKRKVALKLPRQAWGRGLAERMARERDILASLEHPHIARLYDAGVDQHGRPYLALEYVEGQPIDAYAKERGLSVRARLDLLLQVCGAIAFAHSRLVVHRDLKPSNILVTDDGQVRLLDFGIAKLMEGESAKETQLTQLAGRALTLDYASPEQIKGEPIGTASDVYSLGVVAYEMLTGAKPYKLKRGSAAELEEAIAGVDPARASEVATVPATKAALRGDLDAILNKVLKKDTAGRYGTADSLREDIERWIAGQPVSAQPDSRAYVLRKFVERHKLAIAASTITIALLATAAVTAIWQAREAREKAVLAERASQRANAVKGFLVDLFKANSMSQPSPLKAQATTARQLLDLGTERIATSLQDEPESRAELLNVIAALYDGLGVGEKAADLAAERVAVLRKVHGDRDARVAEALIAQAWYLGGSQVSARRGLPLLLEARAIFDAIGETSSRRRGDMMSTIAKLHATGSLEEMQAAADEAVRILRPYRVDSEDRLSAALTFAARARSQRGQPVEAEALQREAVAEYKKGPDVSLSNLVTMLVVLGELQGVLMNYDAADATFREAIALSRDKLGEYHIATLSAQRRYGTVLFAVGQRAEGRRILANVLPAIVRTRGEGDPTFTSGARIALATALLGEGQLKEALSLAQLGVAPSRTHYAGSWVLANEIRLLALITLQLGRYAEASRLLDEAVSMERSMTLQPWVRNRFRLAQARLALATGRPEAAVEQLDLVVLPGFARSLPLVQETVEKQVLLALAAIQAGDAPRARSLAEAARQTLAESSVRDRFGALESDAALALGLAQLALDDAAAVETLRAALKLREATHAAVSPWLAEAQLALAMALTRFGSPAEAAPLRRRAEPLLVASGAGPHFRPKLRVAPP